MHNGTVVILGQLSNSLAHAAQAAAEMASADLVAEPSVHNLLEWMVDDRPLAVLAPMSNEGREAVAVLRNRQNLAAVPVIGVADELSDLMFEEAFCSGLDDVSSGDVRRLGRRLRQLASVGPVDVEAHGRGVVIADADRRGRRIVGRVFRNAGFQVAFADDRPSALELATAGNVYLTIASSEMHGTGHDSLSRQAAERGSHVPWIIAASPRSMAQHQRELAGIVDQKIAVHDAFASPETLLFVANELINRPAVDGRQSERLLYGTTVDFRAAGRRSADEGYSFNVSAGGIYVRTLAPPERGTEVWLEFVPPRSDRLVHLEGTVAWARRYGPGHNATVPIGFGVQITGGSKADVVRYGSSYRSFLAERLSVRRRTGQPVAASVRAPRAGSVRAPRAGSVPPS